MISIDYHIYPKSLEKAKSTDLREADSMALHYDHFLGDVFIRVDKHDLSADWGWVPVLDFAICMSNNVKSLEKEKSCVFEFTESDAYIKMERKENTVFLSTNYSSNSPKIEVDYNELKNTTEIFFTDLLNHLIDKFPELKANSYIQSIGWSLY